MKIDRLRSHRTLNQVASEQDGDLQWPLHGKQVTLGIVEQGKEIRERVTMRRSFTTEPQDSSQASANGSFQTIWS